MLWKSTLQQPQQVGGLQVDLHVLSGRNAAQKQNHEINELLDEFEVPHLLDGNFAVQ